MKVKDVELAATRARMEREKFRQRIQSDESLGKNVVRKMVTRLNSEADKLRKEISEKHLVLR